MDVAQVGSWYWAEAQYPEKSELESLRVRRLQDPALKRADLLRLGKRRMIGWRWAEYLQKVEASLATRWVRERTT